MYIHLFNFILSILNNNVIQTSKTLSFKEINSKLCHSIQHTMILKCQEVFACNERTPVPKLVEYRETMIEEEKNRRKRHGFLFIICFSFLKPRIKCYLISRQSAAVKL